MLSNQHQELIFASIVKLITFSSILILLFIIYFIARESFVIFADISILDFVSNWIWRPVSNPPQIAILPMILATIYVSLIAILIALPISIGTSIFLAVIIDEKYSNLIRAIIDILAGIPSVIYGLIGFTVLVQGFENIFSRSSGESVLAAGILLAIMILPYITSACTESMFKSYQKYKIISQSLGVSKWHMVNSLILSTAKKGILAGLILALARAMGETMAVMMVIGNAPIFPKLFGRAQTIPSLIALEMGGAQIGSLHYHSLYAAGFFLMLLLLIINLIFYFIAKKTHY